MVPSIYAYSWFYYIIINKSEIHNGIQKIVSKQFTTSVLNCVGCVGRVGWKSCVGRGSWVVGRG